MAQSGRRSLEIASLRLQLTCIEADMIKSSMLPSIKLITVLFFEVRMNDAFKYDAIANAEKSDLSWDFINSLNFSNNV